ncbi:MAG: hypothetical protein IMZ64_07980 [Bacteroidetes bacterium]|nr:hypothetical protein [Bacteroidota bacterium]
MKRFGLSRLRFRKWKELLNTVHGKWHSFTKTGDIRYGRSILGYIFKPRYTSFPEFCMNKLTETFKVPSSLDYTIDHIIDISYSNFILGEYNMSDMGADFKFNTIRNVFKYHFKSRKYVINHYSEQLSLPVIQFLKKEFADRDYLNIVMPVKVDLMAVVRNLKMSIGDYVQREFNLVRAGPYYNVRSPLILVA